MRLVVLFQLGDQRYAIDAAHVIRVVPLVRLRSVPHMPAFVAGLLNLWGNSVPVIDLTSLLLGRAARRVMSTRMILLDFPCADQKTRTLGVIAEKVIGTTEVDESSYEDLPINTDGAPYLGPVWRDEEELVQILDVSRLIPAPLQGELFAGFGAEPPANAEENDGGAA